MTTASNLVQAPLPRLYDSILQQQTRAPHAFQAVLDMPYVDADCFEKHEPVVVPARTLLSQLL